MVSGNKAQGGTGGNGGAGAPPGAGGEGGPSDGGAIALFTPVVGNPAIDRSTISGNEAVAGKGGIDGPEAAPATRTRSPTAAGSSPRLRSTSTTRR